MRVLLAALVVLPAPLQALEYCDELWFTRNLMFHKAGYCFGSALGKEIFGNESCAPGRVTLSEGALAIVDRVRAAEANEGCQVDTTRSALDISMLNWRKLMVDPPIPSLFESSCIGWTAEPIELFSARDASSEPTGVAEEGDTLLFQFEDEGGWSFVEVLAGGEVASVGWTDVVWSEATCTAVAG